MTSKLPPLPFPEDWLIDFQDGTLSSEKRAEVEAFLANNPLWQAEIDAIFGVALSLQTLPKVVAPPGFLQGVRERIQTPSPFTWTWLVGLFSRRRAAVTGSVGALAGAALVLLVFNSPSGEEALEAPATYSVKSEAVSVPQRDYDVAPVAQAPAAMPAPSQKSKAKVAKKTMASEKPQVVTATGRRDGVVAGIGGIGSRRLGGEGKGGYGAGGSSSGVLAGSKSRENKVAQSMSVPKPVSPPKAVPLAVSEEMKAEAPGLFKDDGVFGAAAPMGDSIPLEQNKANVAAPETQTVLSQRSSASDFDGFLDSSDDEKELVEEKRGKKKRFQRREQVQDPEAEVAPIVKEDSLPPGASMGGADEIMEVDGKVRDMLLSLGYSTADLAKQRQPADSVLWWQTVDVSFFPMAPISIAAVLDLVSPLGVTLLQDPRTIAGQGVVFQLKVPEEQKFELPRLLATQGRLVTQAGGGGPGQLTLFILTEDYIF